MRLLSTVLILVLALIHGRATAETPRPKEKIESVPDIADVREGSCDCSMRCANGDAYTVRTNCYYVYYVGTPSTPGSIYATDPATTAGYCEEQGGMERRTCGYPYYPPANVPLTENEKEILEFLGKPRPRKMEE